MSGATKQKNKSLLVTSADIKQFVRQMYNHDDPVMCVWCTKEPPEAQPNTELEAFELEQVILFCKEEVQSMFFPKGIGNKDWNLVLVCLEQQAAPSLGWIMGFAEDSFLPEDWFEELKLEL
jgi:hypothetical protein